MSFGDKGGATGYLVGEENRGLVAMFTMMNLARLSVGTQGVAIMDRACQHAEAYARDRRQGAAIGSPRGTMDPIIAHPDIRRTLGQMQALTQACRAITLATASETDKSARGASEEERRAAANMTALLTPIAKAFPTDCGMAVTSEGIQVHGGMGFIEETGAAQFHRDARILPIYEGTNGIQAIDLVTRKLTLDNGTTLKTLLQQLRAVNDSLGHNQALADEMGDSLAAALSDLESSLAHLTNPASNDPANLLYAATPLLRMMGITIGGALLIKGALKATAENDPAAIRQTALAAIFAHQILPQAHALSREIIGGGDKLKTQTDRLFTHT